MKKTLFEFSKSIFDKVIGISYDDIEFHVTNKIEYAKIEYEKNIKVTIPSPLSIREKYFLEGNVFFDYQEYNNSIWNLYLDTIYHVGAHVCVSNYTQYENWMKDKEFEKCWKIINFIEDGKVEEYLKKDHPEIYQNMTTIKTVYDNYYDNEMQKNSKYSREVFSKYAGIENTKKIWREKVTKTLLKIPDYSIDQITPLLDLIYNNLHLLPKNNYPYCDRPYYKKYQEGIPNMVIPSNPEFKSTIDELNESWLRETF